ncbi:4-hydroxy-tetrahydrodipicolinate synthase [Sporosarcina pasteurii]|uniref:4-hydroxy-tetrahydrodipicolinate synthase n=1 Tax=Sporosarcina pasteurii TaxID=1474 RepID=A0A380C125_SPOPA|nr:4-hydroxy-tetrahydrodipicolinate synthase [Sporosarcina pasteurii]MDS9471429.1 4-hydroxy-tetrahydrodipicolinate synthase [Sporosarcina pasteurii]QBQ04947.1 4-hydroxy-tetrahydrodipicolinate synthase [Sporosarcina pasteurii]SUJ09815.1 Dihydrodipicolinate synthase [Sporosarcina pasteurii]
MNFGQIVTAMVTPFDEQGEIDFPATSNLIEYLIANGSDSLVIAGTTGESPTLTDDEKVELFKYTVEVVQGRVPVIAGTGSNNTKASIELTMRAEEVGVNGIMLVSPYYNKPCQEGLYEHFKTIAASTSLPIMLYNIPGRSAVNMEVETTVRLANISNIVAIKEASADLDAMAKIIEQTPDEFSLYSGDDSLALPVLAIGGVGVVSVSSHIIGNNMQTMLENFTNGDVQQAARDHRRLLPVMKAMFATPNPTAVKAALNIKGVDVGGVRLPMIPLNEEQLHELQEVLLTHDRMAI